MFFNNYLRRQMYCETQRHSERCNFGRCNLRRQMYYKITLVLILLYFNNITYIMVKHRKIK